jgi:hypothetical protein
MQTLLYCAALAVGCDHDLEVCKNPQPEEAACLACLNSNCNAVVQSIESDCSDVLGCAQGCNCSDDYCLMNCNLMKTCDGGNFGACPACDSACKGVILHL